MDVEALTRDLIGRPFKYGGRGPDCYDCYGLVREMYRRMGKEVPDYHSPTTSGEIVAAMLSGRVMWQEVEERPGVVAMMKLAKSMHVGFLLPHGRMIHVWERSGGVCIEYFSIWRPRAIGFYDYAG